MNLVGISFADGTWTEQALNKPVTNAAALCTAGFGLHLKYKIN